MYVDYSNQPVDVGLTLCSLIVVGLNWILLLVYLGFRHRFRRRIIRKDVGEEGFEVALKQMTKMDRPALISLSLISGTLWILANLIHTGCIEMMPVSPGLCLEVRWWLGYGLGYTLWVSLTLYRVIRMWFKWAKISTPYHALIWIFILLTPTLCLLLLATLFNTPQIKPDNHGGMVCVDTLPWKTALHTVAFAYLPVTTFFIVSLRRVWRSYTKVAPFAMFLFLAFAVMLLTLIVDFVNPTSVGGRQLIALFTLITVALHWATYWVLLAAEFRKDRLDDLKLSRRIELNRKSLDESTEGNTNNILIPTSLSSSDKNKRQTSYVEQRSNVFIPQTDQQAEWYKRMWNTLHGVQNQESTTERNHFQVPPTHHMSQSARTTNQLMQNNFDAFIESLHPVDRERVKRDRGYFQHEAMNVQRDIAEENQVQSEGIAEKQPGSQPGVSVTVAPTAKSAQTIVVKTPNSPVGDNGAGLFSKPRYSSAE